AGDVAESARTGEVENVPGFQFVQDFTPADPADQEKEDNGGDLLDREQLEEDYGPLAFDIGTLTNGGTPYPGEHLQTPSDPADVLTNNNNGATGSANFTQSETSVLAFGNRIVVSYNDSGSNAGGTNKF